MWRNYLVVAVRNLLKNRLYSFINIGGLAVGLAACLIILLFVTDELSYEEWLPKAERIAVFEGEIRVPGRDTMAFAGSPGLLAPALAKDFSSDIEATTRVFDTNDTVRIGDKQFLSSFNYVDANFFDLFDLPVVAGSRDKILADNRSVALTQKLARTYFGGEPAVGKTLLVAGKYDYTVVAVLADLPDNTHLELEALALFDGPRYKDRPWIAEQWTSANLMTYALFRTPSSMDRVADELKPFVDRNVRIEVPGWDKLPPSDFMSFQIMPLLDIHLHATRPGYPKKNGDINTVIAFTAIALLILVIACINFVNLATARAMQRAREVAMRKVLGATRSQLIFQHLGEAVVTALIALILAFSLVELALPAFNGFVHKSLALRYADPQLVFTALGLILVVGAVGGLYPAFYLSQFRPARVLKANQSSSSASSTMRTALVVFQFAVSIALIICTATVYSQTIYARTVDLGFERANRASLAGLQRLPAKELRETLRREVEALPGVQVASLSSDKPPLTDTNNELLFPNADQTGTQVLVERMYVDVNFFKAYAVKPLAGRLFSEDHPGDYRVEPTDDKTGSQSIVVNESFVRKLGLARNEDVIGKVVWQMADAKKRMARTTIIGVVPDLYLRSLRDPITPFSYALSRDYLSELTFVIAPGRTAETMAAVETIWSRLAAGVPIRSSFVEEDLRAQYDADEQRGQMFAVFAAFAVLIACLGLFGLASFSAERRTKEIGMRKVLGASVLDIVRLLVWQFSRPVLIANLIAWPVAFLLMRRWLAGFRFSIDLTNPLTFLALFGGAGLLALLIAWATTGGHAYRVARGRPGRALRYE
jgi:putative ABC transport system permease protein